MLGVQPYAAQHLNNLILPVLFAGRQFMDINCLTDNITYRHTGIQARIWVLEYNLHFPAVRQHINRLFSEHRFSIGRPGLFVFPVKRHVAAVKYCLAIIDDPAAGRFMEAQKGTARGRLSAARLSYQSERLSLIKKEGDIIDRLYHFLFKHLAAGNREILFQVLDLD